MQCLVPDIVRGGRQARCGKANLVVFLFIIPFSINFSALFHIQVWIELLNSDNVVNRSEGLRKVILDQNNAPKISNGANVYNLSPFGSSMISGGIIIAWVPSSESFIVMCLRTC